MDFIQYGLFSLNMLDELNTMNLQLRFKQWYNKTFLHTCGLRPLADDHPSCTCLDRPVKYKNNQWSLQKAIAYTFNEFLDKSQTRTPWSRPLNFSHIQQYALLNNKIKNIYDRRILYAVNDCLAVTKLLMVLEFIWTKQQLEQYNENKQQQPSQE